MKINLNCNSYLHFGAGYTRIFSDFDGTYMPAEFNHDVLCNDNPPVDSNAFNSYFSEFGKLLSPEILITPTPPVPIGVAIAAIVSNS